MPQRITPGASSVPVVHRDTSGRPAYSGTARAKALAALKLGDTRKAAAGAAGIHRDTLAEWIKADPEFAEQVAIAEDYAEHRYAARLARHSTTSVPATIGWLERRRPADWRLRMTVDTSTPEELIADESDDDRLERIQAALDEVRRRRATGDTGSADGGSQPDGVQ